AVLGVVVQPGHVVSAVEQFLHDVSADEAGGPGDKHVRHGRSFSGGGSVAGRPPAPRPAGRRVARAAGARTRTGTSAGSWGGTGRGRIWTPRAGGPARWWVPPPPAGPAGSPSRSAPGRSRTRCGTRSRPPGRSWCRTP